MMWSYTALPRHCHYLSWYSIVLGGGVASTTPRHGRHDAPHHGHGPSLWYSYDKGFACEFIDGQTFVQLPGEYFSTNRQSFAGIKPAAPPDGWMMNPATMSAVGRRPQYTLSISQY